MAQGASVAAPSKGTSQLPIHMCVRHSDPALRMEYAAALKPPDLVVIDELAQAYGTLVEVNVAHDR
eukprot:4979972-Pyramimonas_sp.AAC.1